MTKQSTISLVALGLAGALSTQALAQDQGALLDALVQEGILKESKAEEIRAKLTRDYEKSSAGKIKLDSSIKQLNFYGDFRGRYQWDESRIQGGSPALAVTAAQPSRNQQRERIRLRLGADIKLADGFFGGFQLQTNNAADSGMQTTADVTTGAGGAGFQNYNIYISRAFLGWDGIKGLTGIVGKQANPFYTGGSELLWDQDINPVGLSEKVEFHKLLGWVGPVEATLTAGQFTFFDNNEGRAAGVNQSDTSTDAWLFETQLLLAYKFDDTHKLSIAPGFLTYNAASTTGLTSTSNATPFAAANGTRGLALALLPGDYTTKLFGFKTKFHWDFSYNVDGATRAEVYGLQGHNGSNDALRHLTRDDVAWLVGVQVGENKKKGDLSFLAQYRQVGVTSIDPNINDSDFGGSKLNVRGPKFGLGYNFSNAVVANLTYQYAFNLRNDLNTQASAVAGAKALADRQSHQIFQADINVKF